MRTLVIRFLSSEDGATAIEYALIGSLISLSIIAGATGIGTKLQGVFSNVNTGFK